jgi:hypothetical protein
MRNVFVLSLLAFATLGIWAASSAFIIAPLLYVGESYPVYFHLGTVPDLIGVVVYGVWAFLFAWLSYRLFTASTFRAVALVFLILFFLFVRGLFIAGNFRSSFLLQQFVFTLFIVAVAWFGMHCSHRNARNI